MTTLEVGDIVMCTVEEIEKTTVFVKIDGDGEANIIMSEIAPGRIRNIRDYVVPKKKIICKVLRLLGNRIDLSLRRVTPKEQKEFKEKLKQEKSYKSIMKTILKDKAEEILQKILEKEKIYDFLEQAKEDPKELERVTGKADAQKILDILKAQKQKTFIIKKEFSMTTIKPNGISLIKEILSQAKDAKIKYISAGKYSIQAEAEDLKKADNTIQEIFKEIEQKAKTQGLEFNIKEK